MSSFRLNPITGELDLVGDGVTYITDVAIIANITDAANWSGGDYTGSTSGLAAGNVYYDEANGIRYEYTGSKLIRNQVNNIV